jgi:hypothetical protein
MVDGGEPARVWRMGRVASGSSGMAVEGEVGLLLGSDMVSARGVVLGRFWKCWTFVAVFLKAVGGCY